MDESKPKNKEACSSRKNKSIQNRRLEAILQILKDKHELSGGNCGTYIPSILHKLNLEYKSIKPLLKQLYEQGEITIHKGGQGRLLKLKVDEKNY